MPTTWLEVAATVAELMAPVFAALLAWVSVKLTAYIKAKVKQQAYANVLLRLNDSVLTLVREAEQTLVREIKLARGDASPGGVRLTQEEAANIKEAVVVKFTRLWGPAGIEELMRILGLNSGVFEDFLNAKVEEAVNVEKRRDPS